MAQRLENISLRGFKTIKELEGFCPGSLSVLIGANGAGKSNFISFFRLLSWALASPPNLQEYVAQAGGASILLHDGPEATSGVSCELVIKTDVGDNGYAFRLGFAADDTLIFLDERYGFARTRQDGAATQLPWQLVQPGGRESGLPGRAAQGDSQSRTAKTILYMLRHIAVYQFHNTSTNSRIRLKWDIDDNRWLKEDGANLAPVLYRLRESEDHAAYQRIVETLRLMLPFFADFELECQYGKLLLSWRERGSDRVFTVSQASDGMLRLMALVVLLLQPEKDIPDVIIVDEPELGLHPYAINVIGGLIRSLSVRKQIIVATQSMSFVDCFEPHEIVVVERKKRQSVFKRLDESVLASWLSEYSLSELWEKSVIGGRP